MRAHNPEGRGAARKLEPDRAGSRRGCRSLTLLGIAWIRRALAGACLGGIRETGTGRSGGGRTARLNTDHPRLKSSYPERDYP